ncbi:hypothetical protein ACK8QS_03330 [Ectopseudomonas mendocina]
MQFPQAYPQLAPRFSGISQRGATEARTFSLRTSNQFITKDFLLGRSALSKT